MLQQACSAEASAWRPRPAAISAIAPGVPCRCFASQRPASHRTQAALTKNPALIWLHLLVTPYPCYPRTPTPVAGRAHLERGAHTSRVPCSQMSRRRKVRRGGDKGQAPVSECWTSMAGASARPSPKSAAPVASSRAPHASSLSSTKAPIMAASTAARSSGPTCL